MIQMLTMTATVSIPRDVKQRVCNPSYPAAAVVGI